MSVKSVSYFLYVATASFILGWWALAFQHQAPSIHVSAPIACDLASLMPQLSPILRSELHQALAGDHAKMLQLIIQWDHDASILENQKIADIQRLPLEQYSYACHLGQLLQTTSALQRQHLNYQLRLDTICDDSHQRLILKDEHRRFLPQTFVSASILLALSDPTAIVALPRQIRNLSQLYSPLLLKQVKPNLEEYSLEQLFLNRPDLSFVSPYSHPATLSALKSLGLHLYVIKNINTLAEIQTTILKLGHACNKPLEAALQAIFLQACLVNVDNRLHALSTHRQHPKKVLYLYGGHSYALPTSKCLVGQLLKRAFVHLPTLQYSSIEAAHAWQVPCELETIAHESPDYLIVAIPHLDANLKQKIHSDLSSFLHSRPIFYIDEVIQSAADQYIALAYFDLFEALAAMHTL
jgi:ABC-type Fe3+-hydroxamate transport system substrate-binding protein